LSELIEHHVEEEETEMFKAAEKLGEKRLAELGSEMANAVESRQPAALKAAR
jgi:hemerythrin-like domain-containing protein